MAVGARLRTIHWAIWVSIGWVVLTAVGYGAVYWWMSVEGNGRIENALSLGQVFTGVAGFGAGIVAVTALAQELRHPAPRLRLSVQRILEGGEERYNVEVINEGSAAAEGVLLRFEPKGVMSWLHNDPVWAPLHGPEADVWRRERALVVGGRVRMERVSIPSDARISVGAENVDTRVAWSSVTLQGSVAMTGTLTPKVTRRGGDDAMGPPE